MKFFSLSTLALAISLSFGATMPAEASVFEILLQKKQHLTHQRHHHNHHQHYEYDDHNSHRRSNHYRYRNNHRSNRRIKLKGNSHRRRVVDQHRRHGHWGH